MMPLTNILFFFLFLSSFFSSSISTLKYFCFQIRGFAVKDIHRTNAHVNHSQSSVKESHQVTKKKRVKGTGNIVEKFCKPDWEMDFLKEEKILTLSSLQSLTLVAVHQTAWQRWGIDTNSYSHQWLPCVPWIPVKEEKVQIDPTHCWRLITHFDIMLLDCTGSFIADETSKTLDTHGDSKDPDKREYK